MQTKPQFHMGRDDKRRLQIFPWSFPLEQWPEQGYFPLEICRGESRHPVIFVESGGARYAIKETTTYMAQREINNLRAIEHRGIPVLSPIGTVTVAAPPVLVEEHGPDGRPQYTSGDRGYTVTRLAPRVVPHSVLFSLPFTRRTKRRLLEAVAAVPGGFHEHGVYCGGPPPANVLVCLYVWRRSC